MKRTLLAAAIAALSTTAFAQSAPIGAPVKLADGSPSNVWFGAVSLGASFSQNTANVKNSTLGAAADANYATAQDKTVLFASTSLVKGAGVKTGDNTKLGARYEWNLSPDMYAFGSLDLERDGILSVYPGSTAPRNLKMRTGLGLGVGYYVIKSEPVTFNVFGGIGFRNDQYSVGSYKATELVIGEESSHKLSDTMSFKQRLVLYPNMKDTSEYRGAFDATLAVKLAGAWNLNLSMVDRFDSRLVKAARKHDTLFLIGVGSKFGG